MYPTDSSDPDNGSKDHLSRPVTYVILYINSTSIKKKNLKITWPSFRHFVKVKTG